MTVGVSTTNIANKWLNAVQGSATFTALSAVYMKLHTADPGASGTTGAAAGSTTRPQVTWAAASGGAIAMNGTAPSWTNGGTTETLSHVSFWDSPTAGNYLGSGALGTTQAWASGNTYTLSAQGWSISPVAA